MSRLSDRDVTFSLAPCTTTRTSAERAAAPVHIARGNDYSSWGFQCKLLAFSLRRGRLLHTTVLAEADVNAGSLHRCCRTRTRCGLRGPWGGNTMVSRPLFLGGWSCVLCYRSAGSSGALARKWGSAPSARRAAARPRTCQLVFLSPKVFTIRFITVSMFAGAERWRILGEGTNRTDAGSKLFGLPCCRDSMHGSH